MITNKMLIAEFGLIFLYIFAFGISDFIVKKYINNDQHYILYYFFIGILGMMILKIASNSKKTTVDEPYFSS